MTATTEATAGWRRAGTAADCTIWLTDEVPLLFQRIPAGDFLMGSRGYDVVEEPRHVVEVSEPFYLGTFPVTQHQWRAVVEPDPDSELDPNPSEFSGDLNPVEEVSWLDAQVWCGIANRWIVNHRQRLSASFTDETLVEAHLRLPSEAHWEYACRAGTMTEYYTGDGETALAAAGWYSANSDGTTHPVGLKQPNAFDLYDMHGNVDEWCDDIWDTDAYKKRVDGVCASTLKAAMIGADEPNADRVVRGGCWFISPWFCRAAFRYGGWPDYRIRDRGFRVCLFRGPCPERSR